MKEWHFFEKIYRVWLVVLVGDIEDFYEFMEQSGYTEMEELKEEGTGSGYCISMTKDNNDRGNTCYILWMRKFETGCLIHELAHLVMFVFTAKGVPIRNENGEAFSYYLEFWYNEISKTRRRLPGGRSSSATRRLSTTLLPTVPRTVDNSEDQGEHQE